ncbi:hypothetical protein ElyMa_002694200 [Elysia marginata]|uniref:Uncharacterized protein n=1 Tax=Elysia marginata TaxID=1093978 RepID=A0AAV4HFS9_9GAST|nr:hypothetical protein ElyMa_002694200 [Elysia marginata]
MNKTVLVSSPLASHDVCGKCHHGGTESIRGRRGPSRLSEAIQETERVEGRQHAPKVHSFSNHETHGTNPSISGMDMDTGQLLDSMKYEGKRESVKPQTIGQLRRLCIESRERMCQGLGKGVGRCRDIKNGK